MKTRVSLIQTGVSSTQHRSENTNSVVEANPPTKHQYVSTFMSILSSSSVDTTEIESLLSTSEKVNRTDTDKFTDVSTLPEKHIGWEASTKTKMAIEEYSTKHVTIPDYTTKTDHWKGFFSTAYADMETTETYFVNSNTTTTGVMNVHVSEITTTAMPKSSKGIPNTDIVTQMNPLSSSVEPLITSTINNSTSASQHTTSNYHISDSKPPVTTVSTKPVYVDGQTPASSPHPSSTFIHLTAPAGEVNYSKYSSTGTTSFKDMKTTNNIYTPESSKQVNTTSSVQHSSTTHQEYPYTDVTRPTTNAVMPTDISLNSSHPMESGTEQVDATTKQIERSTIFCKCDLYINGDGIILVWFRSG